MLQMLHEIASDLLPAIPNPSKKRDITDKKKENERREIQAKSSNTVKIEKT